ncbi:hypothetical protein Scel_55550 [Streptomyces cellostaticus]|nr:hypothetical protein Scel_55550 [Streptomyces cellostaticus]
MPAYAQRSPSEALSPSAGPRRDRPTAISSDVWLCPKLHRRARPTPVRLRTVRAVRGGRARGVEGAGGWPESVGQEPTDLGELELSHL